MENNGLKIPKHVAIICDGNGRWATQRGLARSFGHKAGYENLKELSRYILNKGVSVLSIYAFSKENFNRNINEVNYLMDLFIMAFKKDFNYFYKEGIKVIFSGRREPLNSKVLDAMDEITFKTKDNTKGIFNICLNYSGHLEIIDASIKMHEDIVSKKINIDSITEDSFSKYLYQNLPPIDLLIRPGGEERISGFMLWQISYAEFYFTETYFPDFNEKEFDKALEVYNGRNRRFGRIDSK